MVKSVIGEETLLNLAEERLSQSGVPAQVGLVVGKLNAGSERGFVFNLIPTPPNDGGEPPCSLSESGSAKIGRDDKKKSSKGKSQPETSSLLIDTQWVVEHARQVSKMLLGGMNVVGLYIWASESSFKTSSITLCQAVMAVAEANPFYEESNLVERLLIHISYSPRRWSCRNCTLSPSITSSSLRPCDFKMGKVLASLQTFRCRHNFEVRVPIYEDASNASTFGGILRKGISYHAKELKEAKFLVDGNLVIKEPPCTSDNSHEVELLLPFMKDGPIEACSTKKVVGLIVFCGAICASAYLSPREPISQAISDIKGDIITSLRSRLDIICDVEDRAVDSTGNGGDKAVDPNSMEMPVHQLVLHEWRKLCCLSFPRRVLVPWLDGVFICDYLQPSETFQDLRDHCREMMSMEVPVDSSSILEQATSLTMNSFWDIVGGNSVSSSDSSRTKNEKDSQTKEMKGKSKNSIMYSVAAISILILSILIGLGKIVLGSRNIGN